MKKIIGWLMLISIFALFFILQSFKNGFLPTLIGFVVVGILALIVYAAVILITD